MLGALAGQGGPIQTHALPAGSPAIDAGDSFGATTDQRGSPRPIDFADIENRGDGSNIGAFELRAPDRTAPLVSRVKPRENATGIGPGTNVRAFFSEAMMEVSIDTALKIFKAGEDRARKATVTHEGATNKATLDPSAELRPGDNYRLVTTGARTGTPRTAIRRRCGPSR
jgi:hypothetical protein